MSNNWTYQNRVRVSLVLMVAMGGLSAVLAIFALRRVAAANDELISTSVHVLIDATRLQAAANSESAGFRGYLASPEQRFLDERNLAQKEFVRQLGDLAQRVRSGEEKRLLAEIDSAHASLITRQDQTIEIRNARTSASPALFLGQMAIRERLAEDIGRFVTLEQSLLDEAVRNSAGAASLALTMVMLMALGSALLAGATAVFLARGLKRQIGSAVQHVSSSSAELQTSANQQASAAREAVTAMNEIATTMRELLATSRQIADSALQIGQLADKSVVSARTGDATVGKAQEAIENIRRQVEIVVGHMLDLGKKSQMVSSILDIINELAEQTNILSINATIEAAGAGGQGRRFAVVADEIRKLADRVAGSTKEIRIFVEEIRGAVNTTVLATEGGSKSVEAGLHHFEEVGRAFQQISEMVGNAMQATREIELSTKQQMSAVEQVNTAVTNAAQASRETESSTGQTLTTATQLADLSRSLSSLVQTRIAV